MVSYRPLKPSAETLKRRKQAEHFIRAQYKFWVEEATVREKGEVATLEVLEEVILVSTAFHVNKDGNVEFMVLKKDMPIEALKHTEVGYWLATAGPGPKHEQDEVVKVHGCPAVVMEVITKTNSLELIASYVYPFLDVWNLCGRHYLVIIACAFLSGSMIIIQPILVMGESSKLARLFLSGVLARIWKQTITAAQFQRFLQGNFDRDFLTFILIVLIIIWDKLPYKPDVWIRCYGIPVVVAYGPMDNHYCLYIPKQDPYKPYHTVSLRHVSSELDRCARQMTELARKFVAAAPPCPNDMRRRQWLVELRALIVAEAVNIGLWQALKDAKAAFTKASESFNSLKRLLGQAQQAKEIGEEEIEALHLQAVARGEAAHASRLESVILAVGEAGSAERIEWVQSRINAVRRDIEGGVTIGLPACPRPMLHGTIDHAEWLLRQVKEGKDIVISACGWEQFAAPLSKNTDARAALQRAAGFGKADKALNFSQQSLETVLGALLNGSFTTGSGREVSDPSFFLYLCPLCHMRWCQFGDSNVREAWKGAQAAKKEDDGVLEGLEAVPEASKLEEKLWMTRSTYDDILPWDMGELIQADPGWADMLKQKPPPAGGRIREDRRSRLDSPLHIKAMDAFGRLRHHSLQFYTIKYPHQLVDIELLPELFEDDKPKLGDFRFVRLSTFAQKHAEALREMDEVSEGMLEEAGTADTTWLVSTTKKFSKSQAVTAMQAPKLDYTPPALGRADIVQAARSRISAGIFKPYMLDYETGRDLYREDVRLKEYYKPTVAVGAVTAEVAGPIASGEVEVPGTAALEQDDEVAEDVKSLAVLKEGEDDAMLEQDQEKDNLGNSQDLEHPEIAVGELPHEVPEEVPDEVAEEVLEEDVGEAEGGQEADVGEFGDRTQEEELFGTGEFEALDVAERQQPVPAPARKVQLAGGGRGGPSISDLLAAGQARRNVPDLVNNLRRPT